MSITAPTGKWRLVAPAEDASSAREFSGADAFQAVLQVAQATGARYTWDAERGKLYVGARITPASKPAEAPGRILLPVPYYSQLDSGTRHALRMCFSSSCAMLLKFLKPGALSNSPNADDEYLGRVFEYGDTTIGGAQEQALAHFGVKARHRTDLTWADIDRQLARGIPVPIGILHHGPVEAPSGGGHWLVVIGREGKNLIVHDPAGDLDLLGGGYLGGSGKQLRYSEKNLTPRWRVNGTGGYGMMVS